MDMIRNRETRQTQTHPAAPSPTHERILLVLGMTQRPLGSSEIENALGLVTTEARRACSWLTDNGYITSTARVGKAVPRKAMPFWSLADKGRSWVKGQGALLA